MDQTSPKMFSEEDSDASSTVSELEEQLETFLDSLTAGVDSEFMDDDADELIDQYGMHGCKERLQRSISKFLRDDQPYEDLELTDDDSLAQVISPAGGERMVDPESAELVNTVPFNLSENVCFPPDTRVDPREVGALNKILELHQEKGRTILDYYCKEYGPEAIWRVGTRALLSSEIDDMFVHEDDTHTRLNSKKLSFLAQVYSEHPRRPNIAEVRILSVTLDCEPVVVERYWDYETKKKLAYMAMLAVAAAKDERREEAEEEIQAASTSTCSDNIDNSSDSIEIKIEEEWTDHQLLPYKAESEVDPW